MTAPGFQEKTGGGFASKFVKYRPPKPTGRLEGSYLLSERQANILSKQTDIWKPSVHYRYQLQDIQDQLTPAENYKNRLKGAGKEERILQRLEWRWERDIAKWNHAAVVAASAYRAWKVRLFFKSIRHNLEVQREQREAKTKAVELFNENRKEDALIVIDIITEPSVQLLIMKGKILYSMERFAEVEVAAARIIAMDEYCDHGYFLLAASLARRKEYRQAYELLKRCLTATDDAREEVYRLNGFLCTKLTPPNYVEAVQNFDALVKKYPEDMNALLQRACCLSCMQEWPRVIADLTLILEYQPDLPHVLCLRARAYCCSRQWLKGKGDYQRVLTLYPDDPTALYGMADAITKDEELPSLDEGLINDAM